MSVESIALVLHHSQATGTAKLVLIGIANHDGDGGAWPTVTTLARYANCSERTVQRCLTELAALGEISVEVNSGGGSWTRADRRPNRYEVLVACPPGCDRSKNHRVERGDADVTPSIERGDIPDVNGVTSLTERGDTAVTRTVLEPSPQPSLLNVDFAFADFWDAYPRKAGKISARKAFEKALRVVDAETIIAGAQRYAADPNRDPAFTAHAATWLNAGRWDDEPLPGPAARPASGARVYAEIASGGLALDWSGQ